MHERTVQCRARVKKGNVTSSFQRSFANSSNMHTCSCREITTILHAEESEFEKGACSLPCFIPPFPIGGVPMGVVWGIQTPHEIPKF